MEIPPALPGTLLKQRMLRFVYYLLFVNLAPLPYGRKGMGQPSIGREAGLTASPFTSAQPSFRCQPVQQCRFTIRVPLSARQTPDFTELYHAPAFEHLRFNIKKLNVTDGTYDYYLIVGNGNAQRLSVRSYCPMFPFRVLKLASGETQTGWHWSILTMTSRK